MTSGTFTLVVVAFLLGAVSLVALAYVRMRYSDALRQARAIGYLQCLGCMFVYRHEWNQTEGHSGHGRRLQFLDRLMGERHWPEAAGMLLTNFKGGVTHLAPLGELTTITDLSITDSPGITDEIFEIILRLTELRSISLHGTSITGTGALQLVRLRKLKELMVSATQINQKELQHLRACLRNCRIDHDQEHAKHVEEDMRRFLVAKQQERS